MPIIQNPFLKTLVISLITSVFLFLVCKSFVIDIAKVDSLAMSPKMKLNQTVFIRPITFLSSQLKREDVVQVTLPLNKKDTLTRKGLFFKQIIGLPGDTVVICKSQVFINGKPADINKDLLHNYVIKTKLQKDTAVFDSLGVTEKYLIDDSCAYMVTLTNAQYTDIKDKGITIKEHREDSALYDESVFPNNPNIKWNKDFFGPLYIPKKGDVIKLDTNTFKIYQRIMNDFEGANISVEGNKIFFHQSDVITSYTITQDYYFVIGNNFDNSIDSRYWGFIPKKNIKAKWVR
jgi:signal peptidase I